ncbi:hypothetical protein ABBQ38_006851 [Trebouxia sp. C0009 RCD-2024]
MHATVGFNGVRSATVVLNNISQLKTPQLSAGRLHGRTLRLRCSAEGKSPDRSLGDKLVGKYPSTVVVAAADTQKEAKKRIDRADLYTDNWGGDVWKGGKVNVLSIILAVSILVPLGGLLFAYLTFGTLWG